MFNINDYKDKINIINSLLIENNNSTNKLINNINVIVSESNENKDIIKLKNKLIRKIIEE